MNDTPERVPSRPRAILREVGQIALMLGLVFSARSALADWYHVPSGSMHPTLLEGDRILVDKRAYDLRIPFTYTRIAHWAEPEPGDVVIFDSLEDDTVLVKRVVAVAGDEVAMHEGRLIINGVMADYADLDPGQLGPMPESWRDPDFEVERVAGEQRVLRRLNRSHPAQRGFAPVTVPEGHVFVLGDSRENSRDSRFFGFVPRERIVGRAERVMFSFDNERTFALRSDRAWVDL
jgi:signal peptidase I